MRTLPLPSLSRRQMLQRCANGFGAVALAKLMTERAYGDHSPLAPRPTHYPAKAQRVIFLYMDGGPSQVDTFDPKPRLTREHGEPIRMAAPPTQFIAHDSPPRVMASPFRFRQHGQCGTPVSEIFPHLATCVDDMAIVRSMVSGFAEHANANLFLHTGFNQQGRPSVGSWVTYGLGSECQNLPGYIVLKGGFIPAGGPDNFNNGYLPAVYQGSIFRDTQAPVANLEAPAPQRQRERMDLLRELDRASADRYAHDDRVEAAIANYEMAFQMQAAVPELLDITGESPATRRLYGVDEEVTRTYGMQCLMARRLVERGVRFVEVMPPQVAGANRWDQHDRLKDGHEGMARAVDRPVAALLKDLKSRGLLESTLVVWAGEFGRTPVAQGAATGRDHNPYGYSIWMAGAGIQGGTIYGATDEYGFHAVENRVQVHDLHATMLHLLGLDHRRLTYRFGGRDMRLTDVHGEIVEGILS